MRRLWIALFAVVACTTTTPVAHVSPSPVRTPSPAASPAASPVLGVFADATAGEVALVDSNGRMVAKATVAPPHRSNQGLPWTSSTEETLYYLAAGGDVHFLRPDGTTGQVTHLVLAAGEEAGIAVSPDDKRIAVAILRYTSGASPTFLGMRMYVEDLGSASHHSQIYASTINAEFPIGWTGGRLIVALSTPFCCQSVPQNPYGAVEYHVVDASTGNRLVTLCRGLGPWGPPTTIGVACRSAGIAGIDWRGWDGAVCCSPGTAAGPILSPDGTQAAGPGAGTIQVSGPGPAYVVTHVAGEPVAWLDLTHIVYRLKADSALYIGELPSLAGAKVPLDGPTTTFAGTVPSTIR